MKNKRSNTTETVILALEVLRRIPRGRKVTAAELHAQLRDAGTERDLRTIQRQLEMLSEHFPIERDDRSKPYGYTWREKAESLALPNLTPQESLLLLLAQEHLRHLLPSRLMHGMEGFFAQARRNLGPDSNAQLEKQWPDKVRVVATSQPLLPPRLQPDVFETVSEALYANRWLRLNYCNAQGKLGDIEVMPLGLAQQGPRLYLVCRYKGYDNERSLALHRIQRAEATPFTFKRPPGFDLRQYDDDGRFGISKGQRIRLSFHISQPAGLHLLESPLSTDQTVETTAEGYRITATVVETAVLTWWLRGFGEAVSEVRRELVDAAPSEIESSNSLRDAGQ